MSRNRIGNYEIWDEIARGGMGAVYRGYQPSLGRMVAIKMLLPDLAGDSDFLERFHMEAGAIALLNQANIVRIHDIERAGDTTYIIMEFVAGPSLRRVLRGAGRLAPGRASDLAIQAARGLSVAHEAGIVHRDIKPENLLLSGHGLLKVMDFGVAKLATARLKTRTGTALGTPAYMSPEQARGERVDGRSDLYSLTTVLFELVTGRLPFVGADPFAIALQHMRDPPPDPASLRPDLPPGFSAVLFRGLAKSPAERFQTAAELIAELEPYAEAARSRRAESRARTSLDRCPGCRESVRADFATCPACGQGLESPCGACGQPFRVGLATCPFCWAPAREAPVRTDPHAVTHVLRTPGGSPIPSGATQSPAEKKDELLGIRQRLLRRARALHVPKLGPSGDTPAPLAGSPVLTATPPPFPSREAEPPQGGSKCPACDGPLGQGFLRCPFCGEEVR